MCMAEVLERTLYAFESLDQKSYPRAAVVEVMRIIFPEWTMFQARRCKLVPSKTISSQDEALYQDLETCPNKGPTMTDEKRSGPTADKVKLDILYA